jgi:APA family basic amino acid/polyamine antiporter
LDGAAIVISNVVGIGIFTVPGLIAGMVPHAGWILTLWLAGGILAFAGATAYAALARAYPRAGGEYVYIREIFGPAAGFLSGWTSFVAGFSGAIAAGAIGFAAYAGQYWSFAGSHAVLLRVPLRLVTIEISPQKLTAIGIIFVLSAIHALGIGPGRVLQDVLTGAKMIALLGMITVGFCFGQGSWSNLRSAGARVGFFAWLLALVPVMFSYSGWNAAAYVAEEVREPKRNVPRALLLGTTAVVVLYLALNLLYLHSMPVSALQTAVRGGEIAAGQLFARAGSSVMTPVLLLAIAGGLSAMVLAGPRVAFAMARDGAFFGPLARVSPQFCTPAIAIFGQSIWSALLILSGTFEELLIYTGSCVVLFSGLAVAGVLVRAARGRGGVSKFTMTSAVVFVIASVAMLLNAWVQAPRISLIGMAVVLSGLPIYVLSEFLRPGGAKLSELFQGGSKEP